MPYVLDIKNSKFLVLFKVSSFIYKRIYDYDGNEVSSSELEVIKQDISYFKAFYISD